MLIEVGNVLSWSTGRPVDALQYIIMSAQNQSVNHFFIRGEFRQSAINFHLSPPLHNTLLRCEMVGGLPLSGHSAKIQVTKACDARKFQEHFTRDWRDDFMSVPNPDQTRPALPFPPPSPTGRSCSCGCHSRSESELAGGVVVPPTDDSVVPDFYLAEGMCS